MFAQWIEKMSAPRKSYPEAWTKSYFFEEEEVDLSSKAANSSVWLLAQTSTRRGFQLIVSAVLARYLFPEDFGLIGIAGIVMGAVALFGQTGLGAAVIHRKHVSRLDLSTVFWFNVAVGAVLYTTCLVISPLAVLYFKNPHVGPLLAVMPLSFIIESTGGVSGTILTKQLRFRQIAVIGIASGLVGSFVSLISVILFDAGYWGLIIGMLCNSTVFTALKWIYTGWNPLFAFDLKALTEMIHYGKNLFFSAFVNYFSANADYFLVGRLLGAASLGIYLFAYQIPHVILREFSQTLSRILFPVLCKVNDDPDRFQRGYLKAVRFISLVSFPVTMGLFAVADHFIYVVYGERWTGVILPLQILCFSGMSKSILTTMGAVFNAKGRPDVNFKWNLAVFPVIVASVYIGSRYGIVGVAWAMTITSYLSFAGMWICMRLAGIRFIYWLGALVPAFLGVLLIDLIVVPVNMFILPQYGLSHLSSLFLLSSIGTGVYAAYIYLFQRETLFELMAFVRRGIRDKS